MPVRVKKWGKKGYAVVDKKGKATKGRLHKSKKKAVKQAQAINLSMIRSGKLKTKRPVKGLKRRKR